MLHQCPEELRDGQDTYLDEKNVRLIEQRTGAAGHPSRARKSFSLAIWPSVAICIAVRQSR